MATRKLGRAGDQRAAILRNLTTALIWNGKIVTTETRAKEVRSIAEKLITLAVREYQNCETVEKETRNEKSQIVKVEKVVDKPSKLAARRQIFALGHIREHAHKKFFLVSFLHAQHRVAIFLIAKYNPVYISL